MIVIDVVGIEPYLANERSADVEQAPDLDGVLFLGDTGGRGGNVRPVRVGGHARYPVVHLVVLPSDADHAEITLVGISDPRLFDVVERLRHPLEEECLTAPGIDVVSFGYADVLRVESGRRYAEGMSPAAQNTVKVSGVFIADTVPCQGDGPREGSVRGSRYRVGEDVHESPDRAGAVEDRCGTADDVDLCDPRRFYRDGVRGVIEDLTSSKYDTGNPAGRPYLVIIFGGRYNLMPVWTLHRNPVYIAIASKEAIRNATATGGADKLMPAFAKSHGGTLTDEQVDVLADGIVQRWGHAQSLAGQNHPSYAATLTGDAAAGKAAYTAYCVRCHASEAMDKNHVAGPISDQGLRTTILAGRPEEGMPDWRSVAATPLSDQQVTDIVAWLATFRKKSAAQSAPTSPVTNSPAQGKEISHE